MAKLKLGAIVIGVSGKLGGHILSSKSGTATIKNNVAKSGVRSLSQQKVRVNTGYLMQLYSQTTIEQQARWRDVIGDYKFRNIFGDKRVRNPFQLFQRINQFRTIVGMSLTFEPPIFHLPTLATACQVTLYNDYLYIKNEAYTVDDYVIVYATKALPNGISNAKRYYRQIAVLPGSLVNNGVDIMPYYLQVFQNLQDGNQIHLAYKTVSAISGYSNNVLIPQDQTLVVTALSDSLNLASTVFYVDGRTIDNSAIVPGSPISTWVDRKNGNNGTQSGTARPSLHIGVKGYPRQVLFDGINDWLNCGNPAILNFRPKIDEFSMVARVGDILNTIGYFISKADAVAGQRQYGLLFDNTWFDVRIGGQGFDGTPFVSLPNSLYIMTVSTTRVVVRVDGVQRMNVTYTGTNLSLNNVNIGCRTNGQYLSNGTMDIIALFNAVLSPAQIAAIEAQYRIN